MITLVRLIILKYIKTKWQLAFWMEFNKQANNLIKNPENIEKKIFPYIVDAIQKANAVEKLSNIPSEMLVKDNK